MASKFTITAELNLQTKNLNQVVNNLRQQFQGANLNIKIKDLASAESQLRKVSTAAKNTSKDVNQLGSSLSQAFKRFTVITAVTGTLVGFTRSVKRAVGDAIEFEREVVKIAQATGKTVSQLKGLVSQIDSVSTSFGIGSKELVLAARTLTQAGFAADKVAGSLKVLAQTELAATFDSIQDTTEGAIALLNQFGKEAQRTGNEVKFLEQSFSAINQVSKEFAVESSDIVTAIRTTGAAFESAGGNLNELIALFTSVRSTTRESAESIATGFRTIFTRVQRVDTINNLKALGINLQDAEGKFIGPIEATKKLSAALSSIDPRDFRFNLVVEELGGFRQVSKVIPLIQQFTVAQKALSVAQGSSGSLAKDAETAQQSLAVQIAKTREEFSRFIRELVGSSSFQDTAQFLLRLANSFIKVADSIKPLIPLIAGFAAIKVGNALGVGLKSFATQGAKGRDVPIGFATGGLVPGSGNGDTVPAMLTPGEFVIRKSSVNKLGARNLARVNKYAGGGIVDQNVVGAAILEPDISETGQSIGSKNFKEIVNLVSPAAQELLSKKNLASKDYERVKNKTWSATLQGLSPKTFTIFRDSIENGLVKGLETAVSGAMSTFSEDLQVKTPVKMPKDQIASFLKGVNDGAYGNMFESMLTFAQGKGIFNSEQDPQRPFDFEAPNGIANVLKDDFKSLTMPYVDAKATFATAKKGSGLFKKIGNQLAIELGGAKSQPREGRYLEKSLQDAQLKAVGISKKNDIELAKQVIGDLKTETAELVLSSTIGKNLRQAVGGDPGYSPMKLFNEKDGKPTSEFSLLFNQAIGAGMKTAEQIKGYIFKNTVSKLPQRKALGGFIEKFANGGFSSGTDTVPAMLTPGEFVVNKKSAQKIGYASLNRMNKVGKYASGGFVQHFANGTTGTGAQNRVFSVGSSGVATITTNEELEKLRKEKDALLKAQQDELAKNTSDLSNKFLILGSVASSVVSQLGLFDQKTADIVSSLTGTFATIKGIGGQLTSAAASFKKVGKDGVITQRVPEKLIKGFDIAVTGFAAAQAIAAARATDFGQKAEDAGKRVDSFIESLAKGSDVSKNQLQKALTEQFTAAENKRARSSQGRSAVVGGISAGIGVGAGAAAAATGVLAPFAPVIAAGVTTLVSPAVDYLVAEFGFFGGNVKKAAKDAEILANVLNSTATSSRDFEKFIQDIDNKNSADIANQSNKLVDAYIYQQQQLSRFQPEDLKTATDEVKERFGQLSEAVKNTENNILRVQGEQLKSAVKRSSQLTSQGFIPDADKLLEPVFASIQSTVRAKYEGEIEAARKVGNVNRVQNLEETQNSEIIKQQEEARRTLNAATQQQLELIAAEKLELDIRNRLIGSLQKQLAISAASERMAYELNRVSDSISDIDARYSGNLTGMKSKYDTSVLGLKSPDEKRLSDALEPVRSLGPIGGDIASNIIDLNKVLPNLEAKLIQFSTATDTATGALFDVEKFVEQSFGVKAGGVVGKALVGIIENTTRGTGGERGVTAAKTSLREPEVRKKIIEEFEKFGESFKTSASDILNNMAAAERGALETAQKLNESRQKQIELSMQSVDSLSRYAENVSKATGKDLSLYEKNYYRNLKQQILAGNLANNSAGIGKRLSDINNSLKNPDLDPNKKAALVLEQSKLKSALEGLANQADRASDVLNQIEKIKAQRESIRDIGREFATGTPEEQNKLAQELQAAMTVAATGTFQSIPQELRKGADAIFERFKDIPGFKQAQNTAIADQFMRMGAPLAAQMVMTETTTPEQKLLTELKFIAFEELKAQLAQMALEKQKQTELQDGINAYSDQIGGYTKKLEALVQKFEDQAKEKAIPLKGEAVPVVGDAMGAALQIPPSDAKAKIDLENIAAINQANKDIAETLKESDTLIDTFQKRINSLNEILDTLVTNEEAKKEKDDKKAAADAFEKEQQLLRKVRENRGEVQPSRMVGGGVRWNADGGLIYRADGGSIFKPRGTDTVPAMLTPGEYVIKKSSVDSIGTDTLDAINSGQYRANGGLIYRQQGGGSSFSAQSNSSIETRLAKLEKRVESLQQENQQLKNELSRLGAGDMQGMSQQMQQMNMSMQQMSDGMNMTAQQFMQPRQGRASRKQRLYEARANARAVSSDSNEPAQVIIPEPPKDRKPTRDKLDLIESFQASGASHLANLISNGTVSLPHAEDASNAMQNMSNAQNITSPDGVKQDLNSRIPRAESALNATLPKKDLSLKDLMSQPQQEEKPFNIGGIGPLPEKEVMEFMGPPTPLQFAKDEYNKRQWQREGAAKQVLAKAKPTMTPEQQQARIAELTAMNKQKNAELKKLPLSPEQERLKENERLRIEQLKGEISAGHQTQQKDGTWRQSTYEEVTRGMKQKPKGVSEEFWLKQILEGQKQGSLKFFQGVAKKGKMAENSDYGSAAQTRSLESQAVIDKAKELGKSADALTERRSGKAVGTNYKSLEDVPVLNAEQVGSPVTMKDIKNLQSQAASPVFSGKNLSPAENIANRTLPNMNPQYEGSDPLSQYLNAKGDIFAKEAVKNRIEDNQTWAGMGLAGSFKRDAGVEAQMQNQQMKDNQLPYTDFSFKNFTSKKKLPFPTGFANGGSTDTIPAMLTPGEYVMNSNAVSKHGKAFMDHLNRGGEVPGFNTGGFVNYLAGGGRSFRGGRTGGRSGVDRRELAKRNGVMSSAQLMQNQFANNPMVQQLGLNAPQVNMQTQQQGGSANAGAGAGATAGAGITEAVQQFSQFVGQFQEAAKMMAGMTMTHKVTIDGQVNINGVDGPGIAKAIKEDIGTYIKEQVENIMNKNNNKAG